MSIERALRRVAYLNVKVDSGLLTTAADELAFLKNEVARLTEEVTLWKDRAASERVDHEATIKHCDRAMDEWSAA